MEQGTNNEKGETESDSGISVQDENATALLQLALEEQRRFHDELTTSFDGQRNKIVYFIATALAILTFLYSGATDSAKSISERLFIPDELYGIIFYFFGLFSLLYALVELIKGARPDTQWEVPSDAIEQHALGDVNDQISKKAFLQSLVNEYEVSSTKNLTVHGKKSEAIKSAFFPLLIGAIILVVLRFFQ